MIAVSNDVVIDVFRQESHRMVGELNEWIEKNKDYWQPPKNEGNHTVSSHKMSVEDIRSDRQVIEQWNHAVEDLREKIKKIGAFRVDGVTIIVDGPVYSRVFRFEATCTV